MKRVAALISLAICFVLLSSCTTALNKTGSATTHLTYSKTVNETPPDSSAHVYLNDYWKAVYQIELHDDLQYKQTLSTSGLLGEQRFGFQIGIIEIDYSISKSGALKIEGVRAPRHIPKNQISLARNAMEKAARSLKPPPEAVILNDQNEVHDTMVFDYR